MFLAEIRTSTKIKLGRSFPVSGTEKARHLDVRFSNQEDASDGLQELSELAEGNEPQSRES